MLSELTKTVLMHIKLVPVERNCQYTVVNSAQTNIKTCGPSPCVNQTTLVSIGKSQAQLRFHLHEGHDLVENTKTDVSEQVRTKRFQ